MTHVADLDMTGRTQEIEGQDMTGHTQEVAMTTGEGMNPEIGNLDMTDPILGTATQNAHMTDHTQGTANPNMTLNMTHVTTGNMTGLTQEIGTTDVVTGQLLGIDMIEVNHVTEETGAQTEEDTHLGTAITQMIGVTQLGTQM